MYRFAVPDLVGAWIVSLVSAVHKIMATAVAGIQERQPRQMRLWRRTLWANVDKPLPVVNTYGARPDAPVQALVGAEAFRWPRPGIDNSEDAGIKIWETEVKGEMRITIWLEAEDYVIILARRQSYILPWTAFVVDQEHRKRKLRAQYEAFQAANN